MLRLNPSLVSANGYSGAVVAEVPREVAALSRVAKVGLAAWCVAVLLAAALIGLNHDPSYATARGEEQVEQGRDADEKAVMEDGLGVAAAGRVIGFALLLGVGAYCFATRPKDAHLRWDGLAMLVAVGLFWALASVCWSVEPGTTARELVRLVAYGGVAAALALRFDLRTLCFVLAAALAGSVGTAVAFEIGTGGFNLGTPIIVSPGRCTATFWRSKPLSWHSWRMPLHSNLASAVHFAGRSLPPRYPS